ncbi:hypothetical protein C8F01DRAFT_816 [Mycena amicta]|nr:hypothetical protein C8F01DRAFT_816 [Mycena amicta]
MDSPTTLDSLPTEIISHIFLQFIPPYPNCPPLAGPESPSLLLLVSRHWRDIALQTPALWCAIRVYEDFQWRVKSLSSTISAWLRRSGSCPLSIELSSQTSFPGALDAFLPHSARWRHLQIYVYSQHIHKLDIEMPLLEQLSLMSLNGHRYPPIALGHTPRLRSMSFAGLACSIRVPCNQLTTVTLTGGLPHSCIVALQHASNLVYCRLAGRRPQHHTHRNPPSAPPHPRPVRETSPRPPRRELPRHLHHPGSPSTAITRILRPGPHRSAQRVLRQDGVSTDDACSAHAWGVDCAPGGVSGSVSAYIDSRPC